MYCSKCGTRTNIDNNFCEECGEKITSVEKKYPAQQQGEVYEEKKKTSGLTWIVTIVVGATVFLITKNAMEGKPYLLFESNTSKKERISRECEQEAQNQARSLRDSKLEVLKEKNNPTEYDLAEIERLESWQTQNLLSRDDKKYLYEECMKLYGY
jgi:uncharacterized membrane protein YvbJ